MIQTLHLFPKLDQKLFEVLESLSQEDWEKPTLAKAWNVKDVTSHILDGTLRGISLSRDGYFGTKAPEINSYRDLVDFLNMLNADWVKASKRLSPDLLVYLLRLCSPLYSDHLKELDLHAPSLFSVSWAGEEHSKVWFHIAREYTEKYHHQQQIRLAVGKDGELLEEVFYLPYLETSMRALPHHYRDTPATTGTVFKIGVRDISKNWFLAKEKEAWRLLEVAANWDSEILINKEIAWQIFTKGISKQNAQENVEIVGNPILGEKLLDMVAVMA